MVRTMGVELREVVLSEVSGVAQVRLKVPSLLHLDLGASIDVACRLYDGDLIGLPSGARVALQAGRFEWHVESPHVLPVTLVFVIGARRILVHLSAQPSTQPLTV